MNPNPSDRLLELQRRFLAGLDRRLGEMSAILADIPDSELLLRAFHSLTGIGGTYGFPEISDISRGCEVVCAAAVEQQRELLPHEIALLAIGIAGVRAASGPASHC